MGVRLNDAPVHARSDAEVVRVDNQPPHDASLAGQSFDRRLQRTLYCESPAVFADH